MNAVVDQLAALQLQVGRIGAAAGRRAPQRNNRPRNRPQQGQGGNGKRGRRQKNTAQPQKRPTPQKQKPNATRPPKKRQTPARNRPVKDIRVKMDTVKSSTFPVLKDGNQTGWAVIVGSGVFKPAHVQGEIDHPDLKGLKFMKAKDLDLHVADVPKSMRKQAAKPGELVPGVYNWRRGPLTFKDDALVDVKGEGRKGDSGQPIMDNAGRVVGFVLGGAVDGEQVRLSAIGFRGSHLDAVQIDYRGADEWCAPALLLLLPLAMACTYDGTTFTCSTPSCQTCCIEKEPEKALKMLEQNIDNENYWDLLLAVTNCPSGRSKRSLSPTDFESKVLSAHSVTSTYRGYCPDCGGHPCLSPISIDDITGSGTDGVLRIRLGAQFGVDATGQAAEPEHIRYTDANGETYATAHPRLTVSTSAGCEVLQAVGHYLLVDCPEGRSLEVRATMGGNRYRCKVQFEHKITPLYTREQNHGAHLSDLTTKCAKFATMQRTTNRYLVSAYDTIPMAVHESSLVKCTTNSCVITVPASAKVVLKRKCDAGTATEQTYTTTTTETCTNPEYSEVQVIRTKPHLLTPGLPAHASTATAKARVPFPFPTVTGDCRLSKATMPKVKTFPGEVELTGRTQYPVRLTTREYGASPNTTDTWIDGRYRVKVTVPAHGVEVRWGNNDPVSYWALEKYAQGHADAHPWELMGHHLDKHPVYAWAFIGVAGALFILAVCTCCCACRWIRYTVSAKRFSPMATQGTSLAAALCCLPGARAETPYLDVVAYLWTNNKAAFALQFAAPLACLLIISYALRHCKLCCKTFLGGRGLLLAGAVLMFAHHSLAYEHTVVIPMDPRAPQYEAVVNRPGYEPLKLAIKVNFTVVTPVASLAYWTCQGKVIAEPPHVGCCKAVTCPNDLSKLSAFFGKSIGGEQCEVFTNVYPLLWGAAHCFCSNENTQFSAVAATVSEYCNEEPNRAEALTVHSGTVSAEVGVTVGTETTFFHAYVDGVTAARNAGYKMVLGPISTDYSPFDSKVVRLGKEVYNFDWPPYAAGSAGTFGDIQARSTNYEKPGDLYADMGIVLNQPSNNYVHTAYTYSASGFIRWLEDLPKPLGSIAPHGCTIKANPLVALDCGVGNVPVSINIPDAKFTRVVKAPKPSEITCKVTTCQYGVDYGGALELHFNGHDTGKCAVHSTTAGIALQVAIANVVPGSNIARTAFSAATPEVRFEVELCDQTVSCAGHCDPPSEHVAITRPHVNSDTTEYISGPAMSWGGGLLMLLVIAAVVSLAVWCCVKQCRARQVRIVRG